MIKRIRKDHPDFPAYNFSSLRDTASNRIRHIAGGEVAAVFLSHGEPVKKDNLLDLYTNRPFGDVFRVLRRLEEDLKPVFNAAPERSLGDAHVAIHVARDQGKDPGASWPRHESSRDRQPGR